MSNPIKYVDPDGRELIYSFKDSKENRVIVDCAKNYYDNDRSVSVWAHGSEDDRGQAMIIYKDFKEWKIRTPENFDKFLKLNSPLYQKNSDSNKTTLVIMHSCSTGKEGGFAQKMSEVLNIVIVAPSENITVLKETAEEEGVKNGGTWNVFYRGKKVDSFEGTKKPIFEDPEQAIKTYIAKYKQLYENKE